MSDGSARASWGVCHDLFRIQGTRDQECMCLGIQDLGGMGHGLVDSGSILYVPRSYGLVHSGSILYVPRDLYTVNMGQGPRVIVGWGVCVWGAYKGGHGPWGLAMGHRGWVFRISPTMLQTCLYSER